MENRQKEEKQKQGKDFLDISHLSPASQIAIKQFYEFWLAESKKVKK